jgi:hypothetical protein
MIEFESYLPNPSAPARFVNKVDPSIGSAGTCRG